MSLHGAAAASPPEPPEGSPPAGSAQDGSPPTSEPEWEGDPSQVTPGQPPTSTIQELDPDESPAPPEKDDLAAALNQAIADLEKGSGLRIGLAYTMLFQGATGSADDRSAGGGDVDLMMRWTLLGRGTKNPGTLVFNSEYRHQIGSQAPAALGPEIGTGIPTTNGFGERDPTVKEFYWVQHALDGALRFGAGRADPENLVAGHKLQSQNTYFLNKAFSGNPAVAYPGAGFAAAASYQWNERWYVGGGAANAYGKTTTIEFDTMVENWDFFTFGEAGWTPELGDLGKGRYRVALWHLAEREVEGGSPLPSDAGFNLIADQDVGERWKFFARYGYSDADSTGIRGLIEGGGAYTGFLGSQSVTGLAVAYADFDDPTRNDETIGEVFQRWQLTQNTQLTVGGQAIFNPADNNEDDVLGVLSVRLRISF